MTLIVFGYGPIEANKNFNLNVYGRLNALAAGMLYQRDETGRIVPTGGRTGGAGLPSEAEAMKRHLLRNFDLPEEVIVLEHQASDTVTNFVHVANILDGLEARSNLTFLAFGFHLSRIRHLADLFGLEGDFIAAEAVVGERSARHQKLLRDLLNLDNETYLKLLTGQVRGMRGLKEIPEYWLPPAAQLQSERRLESIMQSMQVQTFLRSRGLNPAAPTDFKAVLSAIPRRFPEPKPEDRKRAVREAREVSLA